MGEHGKRQNPPSMVAHYFGTISQHSKEFAKAYVIQVNDQKVAFLFPHNLHMQDFYVEDTGGSEV